MTSFLIPSGVLLCLLVFATPYARAEEKSPVCNWSLELFKSKISENCQTEFLGKLTDEQDKIYARKMLRDWALPADTEVVLDYPYLEINGENSLQMVWLTREPAMAWIDGVVVTDNSSDKSLYRKVQRLIAKAHEEKVARLDPVRTFLFGGYAIAAALPKEADIPFIFSVEGYTGSALELLTNKDRKLDGLFEDRGWLSRNFGSNPVHSCKAGRVTEETFDFHGKPIKVLQTGRSEFEIRDLVSNKVVKVDMAHQDDAEKFVYKRRYKDKNGVWHSRTRVKIFGECQGAVSDKLNTVCKDAVNDYVKDHPDVKARFDEINQRSADRSMAVNFAKDFKCEELYLPPTDKSRDSIKKRAEDVLACQKYFAQRLAKSSRLYTLESAKAATFKSCDPGTSKCEELKSDKDVLEAIEGKDKVKTQFEKKAYEAQIQARREYRKALTDLGPLVLKDADRDTLCPEPPDAETGDELKACNPFTGKLKAKERAKLDQAYSGVKDPVAGLEQAEGEVRNRELEKRLLGLMIIGECCNEARSECASKLKDAHGMELKDVDSGVRSTR